MAGQSGCLPCAENRFKGKSSLQSAENGSGQSSFIAKFGFLMMKVHASLDETDNKVDSIVGEKWKIPTKSRSVHRLLWENFLCCLKPNTPPTEYLEFQAKQCPIPHLHLIHPPHPTNFKRRRNQPSGR
ncbi:hypothetical protein DdX_17014 [Ditylenchus destructor]|uniref:Uncharacterized protein n=1 Tax=Ditylenchus destructor TaxID=166010 RepID=A0AAD4MP86_9BILA|nr:hypothetical protein DdX_17014 [Ditylenchus destructor]